MVYRNCIGLVPGVLTVCSFGSGCLSLYTISVYPGREGLGHKMVERPGRMSCCFFLQ